ncbi:MAG TPA: pyridoxamine 5'-phosphate oxidase family protein [Pilimelia sp.]|nr:pyridoxamine 5'-phosphate oxidase family protein [Pilimelia sp.]
MTFQLPTDDSAFARSVRRRVDEEYLVWLTAMGKRGMPQPAPVWFWWDQQARNFLIYNQTHAKRLELIHLNPQVALNFNGYGTGFGIIAFVGTAEYTDDPPAHQHAAYLAKYQHWMTVKFGSPEQFAADFSVPMRVYPIKVRGSSA